MSILVRISYLLSKCQRSKQYNNKSSYVNNKDKYNYNCMNTYFSDQSI